MNAERELTEAYQEWRHLAEAEGEAIVAADWPEVFACQKALLELQKRITRLSSTTRVQWSAVGGDRAAREKGLNSTILDLIKIQQRNRMVLHTLKEATRTKLEQLGQTSLNLKQIKRSYSSTRLSTWSSRS